MTKANLEELIRFIVGEIIAKNSKFEITETEEDSQIVIELTIPKSEAGKIVGKDGTTIWAIRRLASLAGANLGKKVLVTLAE